MTLTTSVIGVLAYFKFRLVIICSHDQFIDFPINKMSEKLNKLNSLNGFGADVMNRVNALKKHPPTGNWRDIQTITMRYTHVTQKNIL